MPPRPAPALGALTFMILRRSTIDLTSPWLPPPSPPWATTMSMPASTCSRACYGEPHNAATFRPAPWMCLIMSGGGLPRASPISMIPVGAGVRFRTAGVAVVFRPAEGFSELVVLALLEVGTPWSMSSFRAKSRCSAAPSSCSVSPKPLGGHVRLDPPVLVGNDDVDGVGLVADALVDPAQRDLQLLGAASDGAEDAVAAGLADGEVDDVCSWSASRHSMPELVGRWEYACLLLNGAVGELKHVLV